jgi:hypothetical protein
MHFLEISIAHTKTKPTTTDNLYPWTTIGGLGSIWGFDLNYMVGFVA